MIKYFSLFKKFLAVSWMLAMEYRSDFFIYTAIDIVWTILDVVFFSVLLSNTQVIGDWNYGQALVALGIFRILSISVWSWLYSSFSQLPRLISEGRLDFYLTKPVDSQFLISVSRFSFSGLASFVSGTFIIIAGLNRLGQHLSVWQLFAVIWLGLVATVLIYAVYFFSLFPSFFAERINNIQHVFSNIYDATKYPPQIYSPFWSRILTSVFPLALMISVPADFLFGRASWQLLFWFHLLTLAFLFVGRYLWLAGLRRYSSASS